MGVTVHERTLLGMTNEEGFALGRGMPTGFEREFSGWCMPASWRDKSRYGFLVVT